MSESPPAQQLLCPYCYKQLRGRTDYCSRCRLPIEPGDAHVTTSGADTWRAATTGPLVASAPAPLALVVSTARLACDASTSCALGRRMLYNNRCSTRG